MASDDQRVSDVSQQAGGYAGVPMTAPQRPPGAERSVPDLVVSVTLLVLAVPVLLVASYAGLFLVMARDSCGIAGECSTLGISAGVGLAVIGPWVALVGVGTWTVVRLVRRRRAWWTALVACAVAAAVWGGGVALVFASVDT